MPGEGCCDLCCQSVQDGGPGAYGASIGPNQIVQSIKPPQSQRRYGPVPLFPVLGALLAQVKIVAMKSCSFFVLG